MPNTGPSTYEVGMAMLRRRRSPLLIADFLTLALRREQEATA
ncbi:hypothetical protein [Nesterenkonia rhizosphaerae]|uniref:LysR family transcriptional regulator n=1 Tax=Nesterenkonia rhizosphaerae TaxID=1348272 RepID=A0ABP9FVK6_9MICC